MVNEWIEITADALDAGKAAAFVADTRAGGIAVFGTYCIILVAFRLAPVSYVVPMREVSIVFGALLGVYLFHESIGRTRIAACAVVAAGVIAIGAGG